MKKLYTFFVAIVISANVFAQTPLKMSYQAVIRDASNQLIVNHSIGMQISILQGSVTGTVVYTETQTPTTNGNGLVSIEIGGGTGFSSIDWSTGNFFIKTETDPTGGTNYTITGTSQLLSVPFALHAKTAETITGTITENDPTFKASEAAKITVLDISKLNNLTGTNTGDQDLSSLASKTALKDSTALVRSLIPNITELNTSLANKVDKEIGKGLSTNDYTSDEKAKLAAIVINSTGYQDLSSLATKTALKDSTALVRSLIPNVTGLATTIYVNSALANKVDKVASKDLSTNDYSTAEKTKLAAITGTNTGDQDLSSLATKIALKDSTALVRSLIPNVSGLATTISVSTGLANKVDKETGKGLSTNDYSTAEKTKLAAITGTNTGDQDLSSLATKTALKDSTALVRSLIPNVTGLATSTSVNTGLANKVDKETGKGLSTNDYSTAEKNKLAAITGTNTGDQDLSSLATKIALKDSTALVRSLIPNVSGLASTTSVNSGLANKVDKVAGKDLSTNDYSTAEKTKLAAITGNNTGDQDLSSLATKTALKDSTALVRSLIPNVSGLATTTSVNTGLANKVDKVAGKDLSTNDYSTAEKSKLAAISGTNTGDQDLSSLATKTALKDSTALVRSLIPNVSGLATTTSVSSGLANKVDKVAGKDLSTNDYSTAEKTKLAAITGTNTGDQDLSSLATKTALNDSSANIRSKIPTKISQLTMNANSQNITNLANPINAQDAATKAYVDELKVMILNLQAEIGVTDSRDGIHYKAVRIGNQVWMSENLKYLPSVSGVNSYTASTTIPYYFVAGYDGTVVANAKISANYNVIGVLYNWPAATTACPKGWHLPNTSEWTELINCLGGPSVAGDKLKEAGNNHWYPYNTTATNSSGFNALSGGLRDLDGEILGMIANGFWWTSNALDANNAYYFLLTSENGTADVTDNFWKEIGMSVRCLKD